MTETSPVSRADLARSITLIESTRADHQEKARMLVQFSLERTGKSIRIGITGVPGVGKSTFIEALGLHVIEQGHKVAVLAIDPSSSKSGGSILGDKTRMPKLTQHEHAFIRPSPTSGTLGGVARHTRETILLCEAAGYDVIIIETVGVGQSEIEVAQMADIFTLLLLPGSGDELQGIKKGIVELADLLVVNKADGDLQAQAKRVQSDYTSAVRLLHASNQAWKPRVLTCSALENQGIAEVWQSILECHNILKNSGQLEERRTAQQMVWLQDELKYQVIDRLHTHPHLAEILNSFQSQIMEGKLLPSAAAAKLIDSIFMVEDEVA